MAFNKKEYGQRYYQENKERLKQKSKEWYDNNREQSIERSKNYHRTHRETVRANQRRTSLCTRDSDGNQIVIQGLNKRAYTGFCELCKAKGLKLNYHHWDNENYNKGVWLCYRCHILSEMVESSLNIQELVDKYISLKNKLDTSLDDI